jgi:heme exporter protein B
LPSAGSTSRTVWAVLAKECRSEWRTRYGLNASLLFAITTLVVVSFAVGRLPDRTDLLSALLWVVLLFASLAALAHTFVREVDGHTMTFLRLVASPTAIALGKRRFNQLLLGVLGIVIVPVDLLLKGGPAPAWGPFLALLGLGSLALSAATTLIGALIAQTRGRGALFAGVSIPVLLPIFAAAVSGTRGQWEGVAVDGELRLLLAYAVAMLALGLLLYDHLWED